MRIAMIGSGYVGLVSGACFAQFGHDVACVDKDEGKIARLRKGEMPIYEPGLDKLVTDNMRAGRLAFGNGLDEAVAGADAVFIAVGTPTRRGDGLKRKLFSLVFNGLFHVLFPGLPARDINAKPKILTSSAYERLTLQSDDWFIDAEIMLQARRLGFRIGEIETEFLGLTGRRSFVKMAAVLEFLRNLLRYRIQELRRRVTK